VGALLAEVLSDKSIAPISFAPLPGVDAFRSKVSIPRDLDPRHGRRCFPVIELGTGELTPPASHTLRRVCDHNPFSLIDDDQGRFLSGFPPGRRIPTTVTPLIRRNSRREKEGFTLMKFRTFFQNLMVFVSMTHLPPPLK